MKNKTDLNDEDYSMKNLEISKEASLLAQKNGFKLKYDPYKLKTFYATYSHLIRPDTKIYLVNNYRGNLRSPSGKYILNGKLKNPGTANLHMFLPHLAFEKNLTLVTPPLDAGWIDYLVSIGVYAKIFNINNQVLPVNLTDMDSSPIEALLESGAYKQIPYRSLLITTFNDASTKYLVKKRKLVHNQDNINSYEGNSKIDQRTDLLPMPPSIITRNRQETIKAAQKFISLGVKKVWVKCGNNVGSGQFMEAVSLKNSEKSLLNVADVVSRIHQEQCMLMKKTEYQKNVYTNAEIMLEADVKQFGNILLEGSIHFISEATDKVTICDYVKQIKDPEDSSKSIGGMNFLPRQDSVELSFPNLMQQIAVHAAIRQRRRNYLGMVGVDLFIVEMTKEKYRNYMFLLEKVGLLPEKISVAYFEDKLIVAILGEINERESFIPPIKRIAINLNYKNYISTTLSNLPDSFDFNNLKELVKKSNIVTSEVIPLTRKPAGISSGAPYYNGIPASFYIGIFSNKNDVERKHRRLLLEAKKIMSK